jgi:outer membrane protein W
MTAAPLAILLLPAAVHADGDPASDRPFIVRTRVVLSGSSDHSEPDGYKVYSGVALEAGLDWAFHRLLALELTARTESREIDVATDVAGEDMRLGSVELLPVHLMLQVRPAWWRAVHPYAGAGVNLTVAWEKSGALDSTELSPSVGPAVQLGSDFDLGSTLLFNLDLRWNLYRTDISNDGTRMARLTVDPISIALGVGARF